MDRPARYPSLLITALIFFVFCSVVFILSALFGYRTAGGYLSPLVLLLLTWLLCKRAGTDLSAVGLALNGRHFLLLILGMITGVVFITGVLLAQQLHEKMQFRPNPAADGRSIAGGILLLLPGVLNEELIFRGYCFQSAVRKLGVLSATLIFALLFMVWHWISWNAWGNYP
jgi:membrane protease YdiL (CAAX protease family)